MPGRQCGECSLCCKSLDVRPLPNDPFEKPGGKWCQHCKPGVGCGIYQQRYKQCHEFECGWLVEDDDIIPDHWFPRKSKMIVTSERLDRVRLIYLNCDVPGVWRKEPFITDIKSWIDEFAPCVVVISESCRTTMALFPNDIAIDIHDVPYDRVTGINMDEVYARYQHQLFGRLEVTTNEHVVMR
jgi:hypothetical protein